MLTVMILNLLVLPLIYSLVLQYQEKSGVKAIVAIPATE